MNVMPLGSASSRNGGNCRGRSWDAVGGVGGKGAWDDSWTVGLLDSVTNTNNPTVQRSNGPTVHRLIAHLPARREQSPALRSPDRDRRPQPASRRRLSRQAAARDRY